MKYVLLLLVLALCTLGTLAQEKEQWQIKGYLVDEVNQYPLANATVALLYARDSSMAVTTSTNEKGVFVLSPVEKGEYKLYMTYLGYQAVLRRLVVNGSVKLIDLDTIFLKRKSLDLAAVEIVNKRKPVVVKKDTLEFNAEFFKTAQYALVEELLKKMPGIQIDRDGTIRVNGEVVKKLLVDGKPFFGNDPKMATRNLTADMVDKVQFIDQKSDWAQFTGVNDGTFVKVVNIRIKKDRKNGYFGKLAGAYGTGPHFALNGNVNQFAEDQQISFLGSGTSINGYQDNGGQSKIDIGVSDNTVSWNGGVNYNRVLGEKLVVGANYTVNNTFMKIQNVSNRTNLLQDTTWFYNQDNITSSNNTRHGLELSIEYKPDTVQRLNVSANFGLESSNASNKNVYASLNERGETINSGSTHLLGNGGISNAAVSMVYLRRFNKVGRALTANVMLNWNGSDVNGFNKNKTLFNQPNGEVLEDSIDQFNTNIVWHRAMDLSFAYMEPLFRYHYLEVNLGYSANRASTGKSTYDYSRLTGLFDKLNDSLTNLFKNVTTIKKAGFNFRGQREVYDYSIGLSAQVNGLNNRNVTKNDQTGYSTLNISPTAGFGYFFSKYKQLRLLYSGITQPPNAVQLQPVPDNSNPLYIRIGNQALKSAFASSFNLDYNSVDPISSGSFAINAVGGFVTNKIVDASWYDSLGRQISQPMNVNGSFNFNFNLSKSLPIKQLQTAVNTGTSITVNRDVNYINRVQESTYNYNFNQYVNFHYAIGELLDFSAAANLSYSKITYSIQRGNNTSYLNTAFSFDWNIRLPLKFAIGGNLDYMLNAGRAEGYNKGVAMMNLTLSKSLFKGQKGLIKLQGFDLFNRNIGISRTVGQNYIEDVRTSALQRFYMLGFSYFFRKSG